MTDSAHSGISSQSSSEGPEDNNNNNNTSNDDDETREETITYNEKWCSYVGIMLSSLVNFASAADVSVDHIYDIKLQKPWSESLEAIFGVVSFIIALFILAFDRIHVLQRKFDFKAVSDGKLEGAVLMFLVILWVVGVGIMTKADGIAYAILNTYFSCWYALGMSIWTLNQWTTAKDIISIHELTRLSKTLSFWYMLFFASLVEMGSAADVFTQLRLNNLPAPPEGKIEYSVAVGAVSILFSTIAILAHYKLICCCKIKPGGMIELFAGIIMCIWWILAVAVLTTDQQIASTIQGVGASTIQGDGASIIVEKYPGSNLYLSLWIGLYASVNICLKWKAAHAMKHMSTVTLQRIDNGNNIQANEDDIE